MAESNLYWSYQSVERRPETVEVFGPIAIPVATAPPDVTYNLLALPIGAILKDAYIDVNPACTHSATCTLDLRTNEATPYEWMTDVDAETAALTRLGTGKIRQEVVASKLQLHVDHGSGNVTVAGEVWVVVEIVRKDY